MRSVLSLFSFYGRARRTSYGLFFVATFVAYFVIAIGFFVWLYRTDQGQIVEDMRRTNPKNAHVFDALLSIPMGVVHASLIACAVLVFLLYVMWIAITVRRLHDIDLTGWLVLIVIVVGLVPYLGYLLVSTVLVFWPGTRGRNRFGPDPRAPPNVADVFGSGRALP